MIVKLKRHTILDIDFDCNLDSKEKEYLVLELLYNQIKGRECLLLEINPRKDSIIYDIALSYERKKVLSKQYLYSLDIKLTKDILRQIIEDEIFYLGRLVIIVDFSDKNKFKELFNLPLNSLYRIGLEIYSMDSDGLSLSIYNPSSFLNENEFMRQIESLRENYKAK